MYINVGSRGFKVENVSNNEEILNNFLNSRYLPLDASKWPSTKMKFPFQVEAAHEL